MRHMAMFLYFIYSFIQITNSFIRFSIFFYQANYKLDILLSVYLLETLAVTVNTDRKGQSVKSPVCVYFQPICLKRDKVMRWSDPFGKTSFSLLSLNRFFFISMSIFIKWNAPRDKIVRGKVLHIIWHKHLINSTNIQWIEIIFLIIISMSPCERFVDLYKCIISYE